MQHLKPTQLTFSIPFVLSEQLIPQDTRMWITWIVRDRDELKTYLSLLRVTGEPIKPEFLERFVVNGCQIVPYILLHMHFWQLGCN